LEEKNQIFLYLLGENLYLFWSRDACCDVYVCVLLAQNHYHCLLDDAFCDGGGVFYVCGAYSFEQQNFIFLLLELKQRINQR